jgi:hypothetical protein
MKLRQRIILVILTCALIGGTFLLPATGLAQTPGQSRSGRPAVPASATQHGWLETASDVASFWVDKTKKDIDKAIEYISGAKVLVFMVGQTRNAAMTSTFGNDFVQCSSGEQCIGNAIRNGNAFILNLANLFYILLLVVIAIATIFDIPAYNAQKLLPRLIIAIILSNFGLFFVEAIANFAQTLTVGLISDNLGNTLIEAAGVTQHGAEIVTARAAFTIGNILTGGGTVPLQFVYEAINPINWFIVAFILTTIILWLTKAGLWVFAIFAPLGVVAGVLPSTAGIGKKFWQKVVSYAFIAPVLVFFIRLAEIVYEALKDNTPAEQGLNPLYQLKPQEFIAAIGTAIILYVGIIFARKMGVEVANWTLGMAQKAFKSAFGASLAIGRFGRSFVGGAVAQGLGFKGGLAESLGESLGNWSGRDRSQVVRQTRGAYYAGLRNAFLQAAGGKETGFLGQTSKMFGTASTGLTEGQDGAIKLLRQIAIPGGLNSMINKMQAEEGPALLAQVNADPNSIYQRALAETSMRRKGALLTMLAEAGKFTRPDATGAVPAGYLSTAAIGMTGLSRSQSKYIESKAVQKNILASSDLAGLQVGSDARREKIGQLVRSVNVGDQDKIALQDADVAYVLRTQNKADLPSIFKKWSDKQKRALGQGLKNALKHAGSDTEFRDLALAAQEAGVSPEEIAANATTPRGIPIASRNTMAATVKKIGARNPASYRLQTGAGSISLASEIRDPADMEKILTNVKTPPAVRQAIKNHARKALKQFDRDVQAAIAAGATPPTTPVGYQSEEVALVAMGNIRAAAKP